MPDLADLYPGFAARWIDTAAGRIFARTGGEGPPLLLLHGYPQTNVMWHRVAAPLAERFSLIIPDLPGYGWSDAPEADAEHAPYTKRAMANAMIEVMDALGHARFRLAGHDRGGRVAYRLALDHPGRLEQLATLDIVPTWTMWHRMDARLANRAWHWMFLALPAPFPETLVGKDPLYYFDTRAAAGTKAKSLAAFDPRALAHYHAFFNDPARIHATCEDYRAGRTTDLTHDEQSRAAGAKITCPMLAIWGAARADEPGSGQVTGPRTVVWTRWPLAALASATGGIPAETDGPLETWREWATNVHGLAIDCGHYLAEEAPDATARALLEFFAAG
jgi:haloacetate dehalogenase